MPMPHCPHLAIHGSCSCSCSCGWRKQKQAARSKKQEAIKAKASKHCALRTALPCLSHHLARRASQLGACRLAACGLSSVVVVVGVGFLIVVVVFFGLGIGIRLGNYKIKSVRVILILNCIIKIIKNKLIHTNTENMEHDELKSEEFEDIISKDPPGNI